MSAAVTGWALRTPLGNDSATFMRRLLAGERAARPNPALEHESSACKIIASIPGLPDCTAHRRFLGRLELFAIDVGVEAFSGHGVDGQRLGLFAATGGLRAGWQELLPILAEQTPAAQACWERGLGRLHPFWLLQHLSNNVHALLSADLGAHGEGATFGGANAGAQALAAALRALESRSIDMAVVVSCDALVSPDALLDGVARGTLTTRAFDTLASPYDEDADGAFPGEGAAALVLERVADAQGAPLAYVDAVATGDGQPGYPQADTLVGALGRFVSQTGMAEMLIDGAGRARPGLDLEERVALASQLGANAPLACIGAATGQLGATSTLVQVIALGQLLAGGLAPPISGLNKAAEGPLHVLERLHPHRARSALGIGLAAPGLIGLVQVDKP
jgi:3-oxoacyl-[acyl-carrier-protein] synthase II